jgi:hypothetical protein
MGLMNFLGLRVGTLIPALQVRKFRVFCREIGAPDGNAAVNRCLEIVSTLYSLDRGGCKIIIRTENGDEHEMDLRNPDLLADD